MVKLLLSDFDYCFFFNFENDNYGKNKLTEM